MVSTGGGVALLVQARDQFSYSAKLLAPHVATRIWIQAYGPFEYPGEDPSVSYTSNLGVRSVSLIVSDLTLFWFKKKNGNINHSDMHVTRMHKLLKILKSKNYADIT